MPTPHTPLLKSAPPPSRRPLTAAVCPTCEQPIPHDRFDEIKERIDARQREQSAAISSRLQEQFAREKTALLEQARLEAETTLERERRLAAEKAVLARDEGRQAGEAAAREQIAAAERASQEAISALQAQVSEAEEANGLLNTQLQTVRLESASAIQKAKAEAAANEEAIRAEARLSAEAAIETKLAEMEHARHEAETAKTAAEEAGAALQVLLDQARRDGEEAIEKARLDAAARELEIRREANEAAESALQEKLAGAELARAEAEAKAVAAEDQVRSLAEAHQVQVAEQREAMERAQAEAVNAEKSAAFEEKMKLSAKVEELQRALDKKSAEELGEGAEIDLFEALKAEFESDRIERVNKGQPGADILHTVIHNGKECGKIIYDSKNHNAWRNEFVTKLSTDQMAAKAEHAILSIRKFPAGARHLHVQDGVLLASPARVVALVTIVREHLVQTHTLRLSNEARTQKTAALYSFITSERCADLFARIDTHAEDLLDIQVKEKKAHEANWRRQGELIRSVQKVRAELCHEIDGILGVGDAAETTR